MRRVGYIPAPLDPCLFCTGAQPAVRVAGFLGDCSGLNVDRPYFGYFTNAITCEWTYWDGGAGSSVVAIYTIATKVWTINAANVNLGSQVTNLVCIGGKVTGTSVVPSIGAGCSINSPAVTFTFG